MPITLKNISLADIEAYRDCIDAVARERSFLAVTQAPSADQLAQQVRASLDAGDVHVLALQDSCVVAWALFARGQGDAVAHRADLSLGVRAEHRGRGLGKRILVAGLAAAAVKGVAQIVLEVRSDNHNAIQLYRSLGFGVVATVKDTMRIDGVSFDALQMSLALQSARPCY